MALSAQVFQAEASVPPNLAVVLCHGYGAPGDDLVPLGRELARRRPELARVRFVFPQAPLSMEGMGWDARAWWPLNLERMLASQKGLDVGQAIRDDVPEGLGAARKLLMAFLRELEKSSGLPIGRIVLGGFSQGSMLATDVALRLEEPPRALAILSGTLLAEREWRPRAPLRRGLPVFQSHGRVDPILPFANAEALRDLLQGAGLNVRFVPFQGGHTIAPEAFEGLAELLAQMVL